MHVKPCNIFLVHYSDYINITCPRQIDIVTYQVRKIKLIRHYVYLSMMYQSILILNKAVIRFSRTRNLETSLNSNTGVSEFRYPFIVYNFSTDWNNSTHRQVCVRTPPPSCLHWWFICANKISVYANFVKWYWNMYPRPGL